MKRFYNIIEKQYDDKKINEFASLYYSILLDFHKQYSQIFNNTNGFIDTNAYIFQTIKQVYNNIDFIDLISNSNIAPFFNKVQSLDKDRILPNIKKKEDELKMLREINQFCDNIMIHNNVRCDNLVYDF